MLAQGPEPAAVIRALTRSGGKFLVPIAGRGMDIFTPITGAKVCDVARSGPEDREPALDAAHAAKEAWGKT